MENKTNKNSFIAIAVCLILIGLLCIRLFYIQVIKHNYYNDKWNDHYEHTSEQTTEVK